MFFPKAGLARRRGRCSLLIEWTPAKSILPEGCEFSQVGWSPPFQNEIHQKAHFMGLGTTSTLFSVVTPVAASKCALNTDYLSRHHACRREKKASRNQRGQKPRPPVFLDIPTLFLATSSQRKAMGGSACTRGRVCVCSRQEGAYICQGGGAPGLRHCELAAC